MRPQQAPNPSANIKLAPAKTQAECPSVCDHGSTKVFFPAGNSCQLHFVIPCYPGLCDPSGKSCSVHCSSAKQCSITATCSQSATCVPDIATCSDATHVRAGSGTLTDCAPYTCLSGGCRSTCRSDMDCVGNFTCKGQICVPKGT